MTGEERAVESGREKARARLVTHPVTVEQLRQLRVLLANVPAREQQQEREAS